MVDPYGRSLVHLFSWSLLTSLGEALLATIVTFFVGGFVASLAAWSASSMVGQAHLLVARTLEGLGIVPVALCLAASLPAASPIAMVPLLALFVWPVYSGVLQAELLFALQLDHVVAARALGVGRARVVRRHVLPVLLPRVMPLFLSALLGYVAVFGGLSYVGVIGSTTSIGYLVSDGSNHLRTNPQYAWGAVVSFSVLLAGIAGTLRLVETRAKGRD